MRKIILIFGIISLVLFSGNAANDAKKSKANESKCAISGIVTDKLTGEPLTGVEVKVIDSGVKLYTDFDGKFEIRDVQAGTHALLINFISYKGLTENIQAEAGNNINLSIKMKSVEK